MSQPIGTKSLQLLKARAARGADRSRCGAEAAGEACRGEWQRSPGGAEEVWEDHASATVREEAESFGMNTVYVNLFGLLSVEEAADRIEEAYRRSLQGTVRNFVIGLIRTLHPTVAAPKTGVTVEPTLDTTIGRRLSSLLDLPVKIHERTGKATLVIFDEFQDVLATKPPLDGLIRSRLEQHESEASYIFAGSQVGMMSRLFDDRSRPFYGQARGIRLGPLPARSSRSHVTERFERTDRRVDDVIEFAPWQTVGGHPQRAMLLAYIFLWESTPKGEAADAVGWERASCRRGARGKGTSSMRSRNALSDTRATRGRGDRAG